MAKMIAVLFVLFVSAPVFAQEPAKKAGVPWWATATMVAGQTADTWSTLDGWSRGCREGNTRTYGNNPSAGRLVTTKVVATVATKLASWAVTKLGAPKVGAAIELGSGGVGFGAAAHNVALSCR